MTDFHDPDPPETQPKKRAKPIQREHILQGRVFRFVGHAIDLTSDKYQFFSFDRSGQSGRFTHAREAERGVRRSTLDTLLVIKGYRDIWWEAKDRGEEPSREQFQMIDKLIAMGRHAGWGDSVAGYCKFLMGLGVPLVPNAAYQAMVLDGHVETLIARAEQKRDGKAKKPRASKAVPRHSPTKAQVRAAAKRGLLFA